MQEWPAGQGYIQREAGFHKDGGEDRMAVAMMSVLVVVLVIRVAGSVVIRVSALVMVVVMRVEARAGHVLAHVPMQSGRRCPSELERYDEHDDQGDEAAHAGDCTARDVFT